jgi:hypothetical protein
MILKIAGSVPPWARAAMRYKTGKIGVFARSIRQRRDNRRYFRVGFLLNGGDGIYQIAKFSVILRE